MQTHTETKSNQSQGGLCKSYIWPGQAGVSFFFSFAFSGWAAAHVAGSFALRKVPHRERKMGKSMCGNSSISYSVRIRIRRLLPTGKRLATPAPTFGPLPPF